MSSEQRKRTFTAGLICKGTYTFFAETDSNWTACRASGSHITAGNGLTRRFSPLRTQRKWPARHQRKRENWDARSFSTRWYSYQNASKVASLIVVSSPPAVLCHTCEADWNWKPEKPALTFTHKHTENMMAITATMVKCEQQTWSIVPTSVMVNTCWYGGKRSRFSSYCSIGRRGNFHSECSVLCPYFCVGRFHGFNRLVFQRRAWTYTDNHHPQALINCVLNVIRLFHSPSLHDPTFSYK